MAGVLSAFDVVVGKKCETCSVSHSDSFSSYNQFKLLIYPVKNSNCKLFAWLLNYFCVLSKFSHLDSNQSNFAPCSPCENHPVPNLEDFHTGPAVCWCQFTWNTCIRRRSPYVLVPRESQESTKNHSSLKCVEFSGPVTLLLNENTIRNSPRQMWVIDNSSVASYGKLPSVNLAFLRILIPYVKYLKMSKALVDAHCNIFSNKWAAYNAQL